MNYPDLIFYVITLAVLFFSGLLPADCWLDTTFFSLVISWRTPFLTDCFFYITQLGNPLSVAGLFLLLGVTEWKTKSSLMAYPCALLSVIIVNVFKMVVKRGRPGQAFAPLIQEPYYSFPSGHALLITTIACLAISLILNRPWQKTFKVFGIAAVGLVAASVCFSRIYLAAHYPSDVLVGVTLAIILYYRLHSVLTGKNKRAQTSVSS